MWKFIGGILFASIVFLTFRVQEVQNDFVPEFGADDYQAVNLGEPNETVILSVHIHDNFVDLQREHNQITGSTPEEAQHIVAFSQYNNQNCIIHIVEPEKLYVPEFYGHEIMHCVYGDWHPGQNGNLDDEEGFTR